MPLSQYDPSQYNRLLQIKEQRLSRLLAPFIDQQPDIFASPDKHFRYRAEFRFWHHGNTADYVLFPKGQKSNPVIVNDYPIGSKSLNQAMKAVKQAVLAHDLLKHRLFQVEFLTSLSGECLITLIYHKPLGDDWKALASQMQDDLNLHIIGRSKKQKITLSQDYILESLLVNGNRYHYRQIEGGFTQPNAYMNQHMLSWACNQLTNSSCDLLELYCGNGNFTLPLSHQFRQVLATEISKSSIKAALHNLKLNRIDNIKLCRLSSEEFTSAYRQERSFRRLKEANIDLEDYHFSTVLVDPPRAGLDSGTLQLISQFDQILYISCNPDSLINNLNTLTKTHRVESSALFDQFPYTNHIEAGILLKMR